ncbi:MAG: hypothetical protein VX938_13990 [Myxococcota bacterium]|nr:hypothetical protein [Myxococcota bacterium]
MSRTLYNKEETARCEEALVARHGRYLADERIDLSARFEEGAVMLTLALTRLDQTSVYRMEAALEVPEDDSVTLSDACDLCLDFLDWYLGQYFGDNRETLLPLDWQAHQFGEHRVMARGDITNPILDDAADAWLRGERPEVELPGRKA